MAHRAGVSLPEVLVAAVLLAVGIGAALGAATTALRLRGAARVRERASQAAHERLSWFAADGCGMVDTLIADSAASARWRVTREVGGVRLVGAVDAGVPGIPHFLRIEARVAC